MAFLTVLSQSDVQEQGMIENHSAPAADGAVAPARPPLRRIDRRILDAAAVIADEPNPDVADIAYLARYLVQVSLPHRSPPDDLPAWSRTNGSVTLTIQPGWDATRNRPIGYPYGTLPRLMLYWMTGEVLRKKTRELQLGSSMAQFMRQLGLDPGHGGATSPARYLKEQSQRLFRARFSFVQTADFPTHSGLVQRERWLDMSVAPEGEVWWTAVSPDQHTMFENWIRLGERFYDSILSNPVPLDMRALQALRQSPLALDLYAWCVWRAFRVYRTGKPVVVPWRALQQQVGANYREQRAFKKKACRAFRKILTVSPHLLLEETEDGIEIRPSRPAILAR